MPPTPKRRAYATLITRASYLAGVVILAETLRKHQAAYPLIVLYTATLLPAAVRALELESPRSNLILHQCHPLIPPSDAKPAALIAERFADTWTKLRVFELFGYDAVCYLDADMAALGNVDAVFENLRRLPDGWLVANHVCVCNLDRDPWAPEDWRPANCAYTPLSHPAALSDPTQPVPGSPGTHHLMNGGMFLFRPNKALWEAMMEFFQNTPLLPTFKFPDQDFLAHFFAGRWRAVGWQYNALKTMRYWHPNIWRDDEVVCLHYVVDKPWTQRVGRDGVAGYRGCDGVTHGWWWDAYAAWERDRMSMPGGGCEVVSLVRKGVAAPLGEVHGWADVGRDSDMNAIGVGVQAFANNKA